jgi:hypothetical protein
MAKLAKVLFIPGHGRAESAARELDPAQRERRARWIVFAMLIGGLGLFWGGTALSLREDTAGIRALPSEARRGLYTRTLDEVETLCRQEAARAGSLRDHCVAQARFVMQLPECTDACLRAAGIVLPHAHR